MSTLLLMEGTDPPKMVQAFVCSRCKVRWIMLDGYQPLSCPCCRKPSKELEAEMAPIDKKPVKP